MPPGRRRTALYVALALLVLAGAGVAAYETLLNKPHAYESVAKIPGVTLTEGKRFGSLLVETDGTVKPDEVYTAYATGAKALLDSSPKLATVKVEIIDHIVVIPGSYLCDRTLFPGDIPRDCATAKSEVTFGKDNKHLLLVANQAGALPAAMRTGLAQAVCIFENDSACDAAKKFAAPVAPAGN
jgi:hypothetical protein